MTGEQFYAAASLLASDRVGVRPVIEWERGMGGKAACERWAALERKYQPNPDDVRPVASLIVEAVSC